MCKCNKQDCMILNCDGHHSCDDDIKLYSTVHYDEYIGDAICNEYITIPKKEYDRLKSLEVNDSDPCEHCEYYNKPMWITPEAHPCRNCHKKNKKVIMPIITY